MYSTREAPRPPLWVTAVDVLSVVLLFLALTVWVKGGFVLHPAGVRVSFREEWRIFAWAIGLLVVRHAFFRRPAIHHRIVSGMREVARTQRALPLDDLLFKPAVPPPRPPNSTLLLRAVAVICLFWGLTFVMTYPQIRVLDRGVSMDIGDPLLSTWRLSWFAHQLPRDPGTSVRREHLLPGEEHPRVLRRDARAVADGRAAPVAGRSPAAGLQPAAALGIRSVGRGDVPPRALADAAHRGGARGGLRLCVPAVPVHALRASRAADGAVDAAVPMGVPPDRRRGADARRAADGSLPGTPDAVVVLLRHLLRDLPDSRRDRAGHWSASRPILAGRSRAGERGGAGCRARHAVHTAVLRRATVGR